MRLKNKLQTPAPAGKKPKARFSPAKAAYYVFLSFMMFLMATQPVYASDVWTKATEIMKDVYNQIVLISTVAAIVTASVALLMMNFSRSGRTVDESRAWLKRICITWAILNGLGFIMAYITPSVIRACATVSHQHQKVPIFFRQPDALLLLKFLYCFLAGGRRQLILMAVCSEPRKIRVFCFRLSQKL